MGVMSILISKGVMVYQDTTHHYRQVCYNSKAKRGKHKIQKLTTMMEWILKYDSKEGDTVLDPTMGSGSTGVSCKSMNR